MSTNIKYTKKAKMVDNPHKREEVNPVLREGPNIRKIFIDEVLSRITPSVILLDLCCGPGNFLKSLSRKIPDGFLAGIDISPEMLKRARDTIPFSNVAIVKGDITRLPFSSSIFDMVTCQLGPVIMSETYRVLKHGGWFIYTGVGPRSNKEIQTVFKERYTFNLYESADETTWKDVILRNVHGGGFERIEIVDFLNYAYYTPEGLTGYLRMVPVVREFDRKKDQPNIKNIAQKYKTSKGIRITHQYFMVRARKIV